MLVAAARLVSVTLGHPMEEEAQPVAGSRAPLIFLTLPQVLAARVAAKRILVVARAVAARVVLLLLLLLLQLRLVPVLPQAPALQALSLVKRPALG